MLTRTLQENNQRRKFSVRNDMVPKWNTMAAKKLKKRIQVMMLLKDPTIKGNPEKATAVYKVSNRETDKNRQDMYLYN